MTLRLPTSPSLVRISAGADSTAPLSPCDFGLPDKFTSWRPSQWNAVERIIHSEKRFSIICAATGFGKSLALMGAAVLSGRRTVVLTATKGLQDQISSDFESLAVDIRGQNNYLCPIAAELGVPPSTNVSEAPCQCGYGCSRRRHGPCEYFDRYREAQVKDLVVTNYQCWMFDEKKEAEAIHVHPMIYELNEGDPRDRRTPVRMLVLDEAHDAPEQLSKFVGVDLSRREVLSLHLEWPDSGLTLDDWRDWALATDQQVLARIAQHESKIRGSGGAKWSKEFKHLREMSRKLGKLAGMRVEDDWIMDEQEVEGRSMKSVRFDPLSPGRYAESALWRGVERVVLVSATVRPKTAELLGIPPDELEFVEYGSTFSPSRRPTITVPSIQMNYRNEQDDDLMMQWLRVLDRVIEDRLDRKGIIHAVSYKRARFIIDNSRHRSAMMVHHSHNRDQVVREFRDADPPAILVSPSVDTGYDFPGDICRYQVIAKIPFASVRDRIIKARQDRDKDYGLYLAAQTLVQMTGRAVRSESDWAETLILDDQAFWFVSKVRKFLPQWWTEAYRREDGVPKPLWFPEVMVEQHPLTPRVETCNWCGERHEAGPENCNDITF